MRIESINIKGFGCLVNRRYDFPADRAALVIADNETGKSTLAAAILAALCGFPKRKQSGEAVKLSEIYRPWNSEIYAVDMDITANGQHLRIERDFAKDTFIVRDTETGKDVSAKYDKDLTSHLLHLTREDFQRIAFISGKDSPSLGPSPVIQTRLSALVDGSSEDTGAETAIVALDGARYTLDTGGPLKTQTAVSRLSASIDEKRRSISLLENSLDMAGEDTRRLDEAKNRQSALRETLTGLDNEYQAARIAEEKANSEQVVKLKSEVEIGQEKAKLSIIEERRMSRAKLGTWFVTCGIGVSLLSLAAMILGFIGIMPSIIGALLGIIAAAGGAVYATKAKWTDADEKLRLESRIEELSVQPSNNAVDPDRSAYSSLEIDKDRQAIREQLDKVTDDVRELDKRVGVAVDAYRRDYKTLQDELHRLEHDLAKAERFGRAIEIAKDVLGEAARDSRRRWAVALNQGASSILPHLNPNYNDLRFDESLSFTIKHIPDNRILEKDDIDSRLSTGAKDQVYLAVRLACCDELSRNCESIPVLLDDPLMASDDNRFASGMRYLAQSFAKGHQIIILSCSRERHEALACEAWFEDCVHRIDNINDHSLMNSIEI